MADDFYDIMNEFKGSNTFEPYKPSLPTTSLDDTEEEDDFILDTNATLKKDDLKKYQFLNPIREYMIERKGVDYKDLDADEVVEDFVDHMRYFNANTVSTAGEVRFISKADDVRKKKAERAYRIYDQLGNVFVNDGVYGAVDGVKDYIYAAATDPTNYLGLLTGGIGKAAASGISLTGKKVITSAVRQAGKEALQSGATRQAAKEAAESAGKEAARRAIHQGMTNKQAGRLYDDVAKRVSEEGRRAIARDAMKKKQKEILASGPGIKLKIKGKEILSGKSALKQTIVLDAGAAVLQDVMAQNVMLQAGAQTSYSALQTGFSSLLGGVAGAAQLGFGKFRGASGLDDTGDELEKISNNVIKELSPVFTGKQSKEAGDIMLKEIEAWNAKVERGGGFTADAMPAELIKNIMLGEDNKGGLAKLFKDSGYKLGREKHISDVMTNVARFLPDEELARINKEMTKYTGIKIGELTENKTALGDLLAKRINEAGKTLNVMSQVRKTLDAGIVASNERLAKTLDEIESKEAIGKELLKAKKSEPLKYGQSVWKRLLVSSPATTAVNVFGFGQFYVGQTMADLFNSGTLMLKGLGQLSVNRAGAQESFRQAAALRHIQAQKMRNLLDPYTTHDAYMNFLDNNEDVRKALFETISGGIDANAERFGMNPSGLLYRNLEPMAIAANKITGVRIQDSFTKSQMFMTELDKYLRLNKKVSLKQALSGEEDIIDEVVLQGALDSTLKSVFSKDYTTKDTPELLRTTAKLVESFSNTPGLGTILPFGRFFNNVVATSFQWSPFSGGFQLFNKFSRYAFNKAKKEGVDVTEGEVFARSAVGTTALVMAMDYDKERREKGLGVYDVEVGGGTVIDAKNTFPFSVFLAAGRILNMKVNGEEVPKELVQEIGTQIGVGQFARDAQFGNDINNLLDTLINADEGARGASIDAFYKTLGNFGAGFTRPLDAVNKTIGFAMGTDGAKDVRQADGLNVLTQSATKYVDNILEALSDSVDLITGKELGLGDESITGEDLQVARRAGEIYDPNPFARLFGLTVKPGRTAVEKAYSMSEMHPWTADERSKLPAYDKAFNSFIAPVLEQQTGALVATPEFEKASLTGKRKMLRTVLSDTKSYIRKEMEKGYLGEEPAKLAMARKASKKGTKEIRKEALKLMKEQYGIEGTLEDFDYNELDIFMEYIEYLEEIYEEVADI
jgi:hypothetical protein